MMNVSAPTANGRTVRAMAKYRVSYSGWYIVEADSVEEALDSDRDYSEFEEWENTDAEEVGDYG